MLKGKILECSNLLIEVDNLNKSALDNSSIIKVNGTFFDSYIKYVLPALESYKLANQYTNDLFSEENLNRLRELCIFTKNAFDTQFVSDPEAYRSSSRALSEELNEKWKKLAESDNEELVGQLKSIRLVFADKLKINNLIHTITDFCNWPLTENSCEKFNAAKDSALQLVSEMHFDFEIEEFLKKIQTETATLFDLSEKVIKWIKDENLEASIALSIR